MKICIIGCGYVGRAAALKWKNAGHEITVTTRSLSRSYELRSIADVVYVLDDDWHDLLKKQDIVLLAVAPDNKSDYAQTYLRSSENLIQGIKGSSVRQVIYTSSTSVYGDYNGQWVNEETIPSPIHENAHILLAAEKVLLKATTSKVKVCIFRVGEIYGPGRNFVDKIKNRQGLAFPGNGESFTNLVHLDEIISALDLAMQKQLNGLFNLCNDIHLTRKEFYHRICQENDLSDVLWDREAKSSHMGNKRIDNSKLKLMGWSPFNVPSMLDNARLGQD